MNNTRNEQSKRNAEYDIEYSKRRLDGTSNTAEARERKKEYMRWYRARKKEEAKAQLNAGHDSNINNDSHSAYSLPSTQVKTRSLSSCGTKIRYLG
jgi:hypothetical protein